MVPVIGRSEYFDELRRNSKFEMFFQFLNHSETTTNFSLDSDIDTIFANAIQSIRDNDRDLFEKTIRDLSARTPRRTSPFVNDDLLIFVLVVGAKKFNFSGESVGKILDARNGEDAEGRLVTKTFSNVLNANYKSLENAFQIIIVLEDVLKINLISWNEKLIFYDRVAKLKFPFYKSDFMNTVSVRAFDVMLRQSEGFFDGRFEALNHFKERFKTRAQIIARGLQIAIMVALSFGLYHLATLIPVVNEFFQNFEPILGILGLSILGNVIPAINRFFYHLILRCFGFPKELY